MYAIIGPDGTLARYLPYGDMDTAHMNETLRAYGIRPLTEELKDINFDLKPQLYLSSKKEAKIQYHSVLTAPIPNEKSRKVIEIDEDKPYSKVLAINKRLSELYMMAYNNEDNSPTHKMEYYIFTEGEVNEFHKFDLGWSLKSVYCYELVLPYNNPKNGLWKFMQKDLKNYFPHIDARVELRPFDAYAIVRHRNLDHLISDGNTPSHKFNKKELILYNSSISKLRDILEEGFPKLRFLDYTGFTKNIDLHVRGNIGRLDNLTAALEMEGLSIVKTKADIKVLSIWPTEIIHF